MNATAKRHPLEEILGYHFTKPDLLTEALIHPSRRNENLESPSFERLEFLGDSVLGLVCSEFLMERNPGANEGQMTARRSSLVKGKSLAETARTIGLGTYIQMSESELKRGGADRANTLEDALEAIFGAIYLDGGLPAARTLFQQLFSEKDFQVTETVPDSDNPKGALQERTQTGDTPIRPEYEIVRIHGPAHNRLFEAVVRVDGKIIGSGNGNSKKEATSEAARAALRPIDHEDS